MFACLAWSFVKTFCLIIFLTGPLPEECVAVLSVDVLLFLLGAGNFSLIKFVKSRKLDELKVYIVIVTFEQGVIECRKHCLWKLLASEDCIAYDIDFSKQIAKRITFHI